MRNYKSILTFASVAILLSTSPLISADDHDDAAAMNQAPTPGGGAGMPTPPAPNPGHNVGGAFDN